jgi:hypothetical protein
MGFLTGPTVANTGSEIINTTPPVELTVESHLKKEKFDDVGNFTNTSPPINPKRIRRT